VVVSVKVEKLPAVFSDEEHGIDDVVELVTRHPER
jgi:hypothetical protein